MEIHSSKDELNLGSVAQNVKEKELNKLAIFQTVTFITEPLWEGNKTNFVFQQSLNSQIQNLVISIPYIFWNLWSGVFDLMELIII